MTLFDRLQQLTIEELAAYNVKQSHTMYMDPYTWEWIDTYRTMDGERFFDDQYEDAVEYEITLLQREIHQNASDWLAGWSSATLLDTEDDSYTI